MNGGSVGRYSSKLASQTEMKQELVGLVNKTFSFTALKTEF